MTGRYRRLLVFSALSVCLSAAQVAASAQGRDTGRTGVAPLPTSPPPTGIQSPLPHPAHGLQTANSPLLYSPTLQQLQGRAASGPLTLQRAVALAISASRPLALAQEALLHAEGITNQARSAFSPTLSENFSYTRLNKGQSASFGGTNVQLVNPNQITLNTEASLPLDIFQQLKAAKDQAEFNEIAARISVNQTLNQTVQTVKADFYSVLRARALVIVAQESLKNNLDQLSDAEKRLKAGTAAPFDVLSAQTNVANAQQQLITARSSVSLAIASLNNAIGLNIDTPLHVSGAGAVETPPGVQPPAATVQGAGSSDDISNVGSEFEQNTLGPVYSHLVQEALHTRPDVLAARAALAAARRGLYIALRSYLPTVSLSAQFSYQPNAAGFSPQTTSSQVSVSVSIPIWDGGISRAAKEQAHASLSNNQTLLRQAEDQVTLDVRNAYLTLLQARDRVAVANQALAQARESYRLALVRYTSGVSTQVEVSNAQAALTQAEQNQVNALYDYNSDRSALDAAVGRYSYHVPGVGYTTPPPAHTLGAEGARR